MKLGRRTFLKLLGLAPVAAPVALEAVKAAEASPLLLGLDLGAGDDRTDLVPLYQVDGNTYRRIPCSTAFQTQFREEFIRNFEHHQSLMRSALTEEGVVKLPARFFAKDY